MAKRAEWRSGIEYHESRSGWQQRRVQDQSQRLPDVITLVHLRQNPTDWPKSVTECFYNHILSIWYKIAWKWDEMKQRVHVFGRAQLGEEEPRCAPEGSPPGRTGRECPRRCAQSSPHPHPLHLADPLRSSSPCLSLGLELKEISIQMKANIIWREGIKDTGASLRSQSRGPSYCRVRFQWAPYRAAHWDRSWEDLTGDGTLTSKRCPTDVKHIRDNLIIDNGNWTRCWWQMWGLKAERTARKESRRGDKLRQINKELKWDMASWRGKRTEFFSRRNDTATLACFPSSAPTKITKKLETRHKSRNQ